MFIIWGKKYVRRKLGYVADFCSICRSAQVFALTRVGLARHLYYITMGGGEPVGHERTCQCCGVTVAADETRYASVSKKALDLAELKLRTFPQFDTFWRERLLLEAQIRAAPASLSAQDRHELIRHPFTVLSPKVEQRFAKVQIDTRTGLSIIGGAFLLVMMPSFPERWLSHGRAEAGWIVLGLVLALVIWQAWGSGRRYMRGEVVPPLARALKPLRPSVDEVDAVLAELKQGGHKIGRKLKVDDLIAHARALSSQAT